MDLGHLGLMRTKDCKAKHFISGGQAIGEEGGWEGREEKREAHRGVLKSAGRRRAKRSAVIEHV